MNPIVKLQHRIWRIENRWLRCPAAVAQFVFVGVPAWLIYWSVTVPAFFVFATIIKGLVGTVDAVELACQSVKAEPREWKERWRVLKALCRSSKSQWEASRPTIIGRKASAGGS